MEPRAPKRVIVVFPRLEEPDLARIRAVRARFDPLAAVVEPHLTLVFPFADPLDDRALAEHVAAAVAGRSRFEIILATVTAYEDEYLFLNLKRGNDELIALHDALYTGALAGHRSRQHTFVPHLTVGRVPPGGLHAALQETAALNTPVTARVEAVSFYRIEHDGTRPLLGEVRLP